MAIQMHQTKSPGFPFCTNGFCTTGLMSRFNSQHHLLQGPVDTNLPVYNSNASNSPNFGVQLEKQWGEIDQYIRFQNEQLRFMIQENGKQQMAELLKILESHSLHILREKDEEIAKAARKRVELEDFLRKLEEENRKWKRVAQEKEAMALALYKTWEEEQKTRASHCLNNGVVANDAESCCNESKGKAKMEEEGMAENKVGCGGVGNFEQITREVMLCKSCHSRSSCILFLPCRHLSSCKACDAFLEACPVCGMPKKASIETLIL